MKGILSLLLLIAFQIGAVSTSSAQVMEVSITFSCVCGYSSTPEAEAMPYPFYESHYATTYDCELRKDMELEKCTDWCIEKGLDTGELIGWSCVPIENPL